MEDNKKLGSQTKEYTVKSIAEELNVHHSTVSRKAKKLFPEKITNGKTTKFSEQERELLLREIPVNRSSLQKGITCALTPIGVSAQVPAQGETLNVSEVAEILGVDDMPLKRIIKELFPEKMKHGRPTNLTEQEVTLIKARMTQNRHLATKDNLSRIADMPKTELEKDLIIIQAEMILEERGEYAKLENKVAAILDDKISSLEKRLLSQIQDQNKEINEIKNNAKTLLTSSKVLDDFIKSAKTTSIGKALFLGQENMESKDIVSYISENKNLIPFSDIEGYTGFKGVDYFTPTAVAEQLNIPNRNKIFDLLKKHRFMFKKFIEKEDYYNCLVNSFKDFPSRKASFFLMERKVYKNLKGIVKKEYNQFFITSKGVEFIQFLIEKESESVDLKTNKHNGISFGNPKYTIPFYFPDLNEKKSLREFLEEYHIVKEFEKVFGYIYKDLSLNKDILISKRKFFNMLYNITRNEIPLLMFIGSLSLRYSIDDVDKK